MLNPLINGFLDGYVIPNFNKDFPGIPIPSVSGVQIKNVQIQTLDGRVSVALSLDFGNLTKTIATSSEPHAERIEVEPYPRSPNANS